MFFVFLMEVLKRAFTPAPRLTDALQVMAASALPMVGKLIGFRIPATAQDDTLAYIGLAVLTYFFIRLVWAPYSIWKEQGETVGALKLELSKPEHLVMQHLAKHRAKARAKLAAKLEEFQTLSFFEVWDNAAAMSAGQHLTTVRNLQAKAGLSVAFEDGRKTLTAIVMREGNIKNSELPLQRASTAALKSLQVHLVGETTPEELALEFRAHEAALRELIAKGAPHPIDGTFDSNAARTGADLS